MKNKKRLQRKAHERYQDVSKEGNNKKHQYGQEQYRNLLEYKKPRLVEYRLKRL